MRLNEGAVISSFALADSQEEKEAEPETEEPLDGTAEPGESDEFVTEMELSEEDGPADAAESEEIPEPEPEEPADGEEDHEDE